MKWSDFTNKVLGAMGKFFMIPMIIVGSVLVFMEPGIGILVILGAVFLFLLVTIGLVIFKPLLVKKYPEEVSKLPPKDPALEKLPKEERMKLPYRSSGQHMVDPAVPYEQLSEIRKIAVDQFGGDIELAFYYLFSEKDKKTQEEYTENMAPEDAAIGMFVLNSTIEQRLTKKEIQRTVDIEYGLHLLGMTREEVLEATKNPFVSGLWKWIGVLMVACITAGVLLGLGEKLFAGANVVGGILGCGATLIVFKVVGMIINCCRFRTVKRLLQEEKAE